MRDMLDFIWVAFRDYWGVWVTGTGAVGLILWLLNYLQNVTGWKMTPRTYAMVLFCTFWFLGTFMAWHDSEKNLRNVIQQRAQDSSNLGTCRANLQTESALKTSWQDRFADQQKTINSLQEPELQQQATINSCVVSLGKLNPLVNTNVTVTAIPIGIQTKPSPLRLGTPIVSYLYAIVISTNRRTNIGGQLKCTHGFLVQRGPQITHTESNLGFAGTGSAVRISDSEYDLSNNDTGAVWDASYPIWLMGISDSNQIEPCSFAVSK